MGDEEGAVLNTQSDDKEMFTMRLKDDSKSEDMAVWMLDFDCVRPMSMDAAGVQQAVDAFYRNDPSLDPGRMSIQMRITECGMCSRSRSRGKVMGFSELKKRL